jgi:hypothetical protein
VFTLPSVEEAQALEARDTWLKKIGEPYWKVDTRSTAGSLDSVQVRVICRGWYSTLGWNYPEVNTGYEGFRKPAQTAYRFGRAATTDAIIAQSFKLSYGPTYLREVVIDIKLTGIPTDDVLMDLCADSAGVPGSVLGSVSVAASAMSGARWHVRFVLATPVTVQANTPYWIKLSRSGAVDTSNHYNVYNELTYSYADGKQMYWNGSAWTDVSSGLADFNFYTVTLALRAGRISTMAGASYGGQFLTGVQLKATVSGYTLRYLEGGLSALEVLEDLFTTGDDSGNELIGRVNRERELIIEPVPAEGTAEYVIGRDGVIRALSGRVVGVSEDLAGKRALLAPGWFDESIILRRVEWTPGGGIRARVEDAYEPVATKQK